MKIAEARADKDYQELLKRKKKDDAKAEALAPYEKFFFQNKVKTESYDVNPQEVRQYFPYESVLKGILDLTAEIYGLTYVAAEDKDVWHPSVKVYDVMRDGEKAGRIYLDMHARPGKYKHQAMFPMQPGVKGKQFPVGGTRLQYAEPGRGRWGPRSSTITMLRRCSTSSGT